MASGESASQINARKKDTPERRAKYAALSAKVVPGVPGANKTEKNLTPTQRQFIKNMGEGDTATNAAIRAGVVPTQAKAISCKWRKIPIVNELIAEERKKYEVAAQMTKQKVMDMHLEAYNMAKLMSEPMTMVASARELGKLCGYYEPAKFQIDVSVNGQLALERMNTLSDAELLKLIADGAPKGSVGALLPALEAPIDQG